MTLEKARLILERYVAHQEAAARMCNVIALVIVANQPFYPLYVWAALGRSEPWTLLTFLSTPFFAAVPFVSRQHPRLARLMLVLAGIANTGLATGIFGPQSGVLLFLLPCVLIVAVCFQEEKRLMSIGVLALPPVLFLVLRNWPGPPWCGCSAAEVSSLTSLHALSVSALVILIGFLSQPKSVDIGLAPGQKQRPD